MENVAFNIGLDVHKKSTTYVVRDKYGEIKAEGKCKTSYSEIKKGVGPYLFSSRTVLESCTGFYPIYKGFKQDEYDIRVANTLQLRQLTAKTDNLDAKRLSEMLRLGNLPESYIPDEKIQQLRSLVHLRHSVRNQKIKIKNQIHAFLNNHGVNIPLSPFSKGWICMLEYYMAENDHIELNLMYDSYKLIQEQFNKITLMVVDYANKNYPETCDLIRSIPGFGPVLTAYAIAEVYPISRFATSKHLRRYAGVVPATKQSDGTTFRGHIPKHASRKLLRWALTSAVMGAARTKTGIAYYYKKKKKQLKSKRMAQIATARGVADILFKVLSTNKPYQTDQECS